MKVYVVERTGVYGRGIVGVFRIKDRALDAAHIAEAREKDNYHDFEVHEFELDKAKELQVSG